MIARLLGGVVVAIAALAATSVAATVYNASPENYRRYVGRLQAGDTLLLSAGDYQNGLPIHNLSGAPRKPILIAGPERGPAATFGARAGYNTISIVDSRYVTIRNLVLEGHGIPVDGVKAEGHSHFAHDIVLENLLIRGHGNNQQNVGISTKCPAWNWVVRRTTILGAGTGMYFGNSDGRAPFVAGLIEGNLIVDSIGYNLQIKHQLPRPDVPGMPTTHSTTIIRDNVFAKPNSGTVEEARPNVLVGHLPLQGAGVDDDYAIYGNFFYENRHEALFQGEGNIALYSNLFVNSYGDAIRIQPHNDIPKRIAVAWNTVVAKGAGVSLMQKQGAPHFAQVVHANLVFAGVPFAGGEQSRNMGRPFADAEAALNRPFAPPGELDLYPRSNWPSSAPETSAASSPFASPFPAPFPDWQRDFNARTRTQDSIGAYSGAGVNPGWLPKLELKPASRRR